MVETRGLPPRTIKVSLVIACAAWIFGILGMRRLRDADSTLGIAVAWPIIYGVALGCIWLFAKFAASLDESSFYGPRKDLQAKLLPFFLWWINAVAVLFPCAFLLISLAAFFGLLHETDAR
jgi:hypothetical protein